MTKEELLERIKENLPQDVLAKFSETTIISPELPVGIADELCLHFGLEIYLSGVRFTKEQALWVFGIFSRLLQTESAIFEERQEGDRREYKLIFHIIELTEIQTIIADIEQDEEE